MENANEAAILARIVGPDKPTLQRQAAEALLALKFAPADHVRMALLAEKANRGALSDVEREELHVYQRVGLFLDLMHSKARASLKQHPSAA